MYCFHEKKSSTGRFLLKHRVPVPPVAFDSDPYPASCPRFTEKGNLEVLLFTIQSKLRANNQKVYTPREGRLISDINKVHGLPFLAHRCPTLGTSPYYPWCRHDSHILSCILHTPFLLPLSLHVSSHNKIIPQSLILLILVINKSNRVHPQSPHHK